MHLSRKNASHWTLSIVRPMLVPANHTANGKSLESNATDKSLPVWDVTLQSSSLAIICLLSILGNFLVAFTLVRKDQLVLPSNRLVFNLTCANFVFSLLVLPFVVASVAEQAWLFGIFWCNFTAFFTLLIGVASILTLAMIAIDRYYAIVKPMVYTMTITTSKSTAMLLWVWIQSCICSLPPLFGWSKFEYVDTTAACTVAWGADISYTAFLFIFCICMPFGVMSACYYYIFQVARTKRRKIHVGTVGEARSGIIPSVAAPASISEAILPRPQHRLSSIPKRPSWTLLSYSTVSKGIRTIGLVLGAVLITWLPYVALAVVETACGGSSCIQRRFQVVATWLMYSSAVGHPVVYGLYNRSIRKEIKACLCPPGAKALKGLPRRNSRRPSFTGSLLEYSPFRLRTPSRRTSLEYGRASIDLGSFAMARAGDRKASQDSGAIMMDSDMDTDLVFLPAYWCGRNSSSAASRLHQFTAKFHKLRGIQSRVHPLPILQAIDLAVTERPPVSHEVTEAGVRAVGATEPDAVSEFGTIPYVGQCWKEGEEMGEREPSMTVIKNSRTSTNKRGESIDEGIENDCVLEDIE